MSKKNMKYAHIGYISGWDAVALMVRTPDEIMAKIANGEVRTELSGCAQIRSEEELITKADGEYTYDKGYIFIYSEGRDFIVSKQMDELKELDGNGDFDVDYVYIDIYCTTK